MELQVLLVSFLVLAQIHGRKCCLREEREELLNIKAYLHTYHSYHNDSTSVDFILSSWVHHPNSDCCSWNRVKCHPSSGRVSMLSLQDLHINQFEVSIDLSMFQTFRELRSLNLSQGFFDTLIHTEVLTNLSNLEVLVLRNNHLAGPLPIQGLCGLKKIRVLDLSENGFEGPLPRCLTNLTSLQALDLSENILTGEIPTSAIARLTSLEYLSLMDNSFEGTVPSSGQFGAFDQSSFRGNQYLSWKNSNRGTTSPVPPPPPPTLSNDTKEDESVIDFTSFIWSFAASYVTVLLILVTILWINPHWRRAWFYFIGTCLFKCFYPYLKDAYY